MFALLPGDRVKSNTIGSPVRRHSPGQQLTARPGQQTRTSGLLIEPTMRHGSIALMTDLGSVGRAQSRSKILRRSPRLDDRRSPQKSPNCTNSRPGRASNAERPPTNCAPAGTSSAKLDAAIESANASRRLSVVINECPDSPIQVSLWGTDGPGQAPSTILANRAPCLLMSQSRNGLATSVNSLSRACRPTYP
jgi:hypothetical protein